MNILKTICVVGLLSFMTGCMPVEDTWVGTYAVDIEESTWLCDDPDAGPVTTTSSNTWVIANDGGGLHLAGRCRLPIYTNTEDHARLGRNTCVSILTSGDRVTVETHGGTLSWADDGFLDGSITFTAHFDDGSCLNGIATVFGYRID